MYLNKQSTDFNDKLIAVLEHFLSLHEADAIWNMLLNMNATVESVELLLREYQQGE